MPEAEDMVNRADSLMLRRRTFLATRPAVQTGASAPAPHLPAEDDDLPVLTEVVSAEAAISEVKPDRVDDTQVILMASEIAHAFGEQLANDLPALLETALLRAEKDSGSGDQSAQRAPQCHFARARSRGKARHLRSPALALGRGDGAELRQPLGIAIVGGLLVSQWLTLYTTPVVYVALDRLRARVLRAVQRRRKPAGALPAAPVVLQGNDG